MGRRSTDSEDDSRSKRKKKQQRRRSSSSSSSSSSSGSRVTSRRSNRRSRSRSRDRERERDRERDRDRDRRRRRRSSSSSSHGSSRRRKSRSAERRSHRSHRSRSRDRRSHSRTRRNRSHSRKRSHSRERDRSRRHKARDKDRERGKDKERARDQDNKDKSKDKDRAEKKADVVNIKALGLEHLTPSEQAKVRMQMVLQAAAKTDEVLKAKVAQREEEARKKLEDGGISLEDQVRRIKELETIEDDSFVPQAFKSSRDSKKVEPVEVKQESETTEPEVVASLPTSIRYNDSDTLAHPSLFMDKEKAEELWLNRLVALRQERLTGIPV